MYFLALLWILQHCYGSLTVGTLHVIRLPSIKAKVCSKFMKENKFVHKAVIQK